jgi:NADH:ubiquinone oxidoreductase subunit 2 (subunit N)
MPLPLPPTIFLAVGGLLLVGGRWLRDVRWVVMVWLIAWVSAAYLLVAHQLGPIAVVKDVTAREVFQSDFLATAGASLALVIGLLFAIGWLDQSQRSETAHERFGFLSFLIAGVMLSVSANDAITLALSFEIVQFAMFVLRHGAFTDAASSSVEATDPAMAPRESTLFWLNVVSSLLIWLGFGLLTSLTGTNQFEEMRMVLAQAYRPGPGRIAIGAGSKLGLLAIGLVVMGIAARVGLTPWRATLSNQLSGVRYGTSGCLIVNSQLAGTFALARLCGTVWSGFSGELIVLLIVLSLTTFAVAGALSARMLISGEGRLRRWVVALTMLQSSWLLIGVIAMTSELAGPESSLAAATGQPETASILIFAAGASLIGLSGLFLLLNHLRRDNRDVEYVEELIGLSQLAPLTATALLVILASLVGHPPLWGCAGKCLLLLIGFNSRTIVASGLTSVLPHQGVIVLLIGAVASSLMAAAVVVQCARVLFFEPPLSRAMPAGGRGSLIAGLIVAAIVIAGGLLPSRWLMLIVQ